MSGVEVEARISVSDEEDRGVIALSRIRGTKLIKVSSYGAGSFGGGGSVHVDPRKLRDALDQLVNEDLGG